MEMPPLLSEVQVYFGIVFLEISMLMIESHSRVSRSCDECSNNGVCDSPVPITLGPDLAGGSDRAMLRPDHINTPLAGYAQCNG